jgi:hypothetical protein
MTPQPLHEITDEQNTDQSFNINTLSLHESLSAFSNLLTAVSSVITAQKLNDDD